MLPKKRDKINSQKEVLFIFVKYNSCLKIPGYRNNLCVLCVSSDF